MKQNYTFSFLFLWCAIGSLIAQNSPELLSKQKEYVVGNRIILTFKNPKKKPFQLLCSYSYGNTVLSPSQNDEEYTFEIPEFIRKKIGLVSWKTINTESLLTGTFSILPIQKPVSLETYVGPPTIEAGDIDYAMMVVIPTDTLDNPIKTGSKVIFKKQFLQSEVTNTIFTKNLISYDLIYAPKKSGRMVLSSESYKLNSKEFTLDILPAIGRNFNIRYERNHKYADGNQITNLYTSKIRDKNNNTVSDGTFVEFFITNQDGNILKAGGTTIEGVAKASIIHPDCESTWKIKAFIDGIANSNVLTISFDQVINNIPVEFSTDNRELKIGPMISFMEQMIPDGLQIELSIYQDGKFLDKIVQQSQDGFTTFKLNRNIYKNGVYDIHITSACNTRKYKTVKLW
ncbi:hypothetical protein BTO06_08820 [Tenacibaculum sp. SZ-18]|uniref:hypothetical protein n=1 Tax=Tenacibaculum sp. SZ-18 TaxID=754423 RepID=UPI000C2D0562|nr:hypothetical protein [Tenacibaculum sp. SZ-18]AUC15233.1 hypothetical protein BTO06_08820 [Tenacibaculum sp. SZ-18]